MERYVCIHGHFYQPPRENPWLEAIELQDSAYPYHDWNERITAECYAANAASRILDGRGLIEKIVNNYGRISFNFGPTLLSWLEAKSPATYAAVLTADRESRERFAGHGSALAQAYNHMILPLANQRDKVTQVIWGLRDFKKRFGRTPEGMWLPETAVDVQTLEILAEQGLRFTILEPGQAARVRKVGSRQFKELDHGSIDPSRAYRVVLPSGRSLAVFFYDGPISRAVAFEGLLSSGERFAHRLLSAFSDGRTWPQLGHIATDGETYGHHHGNGDMALAVALDTIESQGLARLTNYAQYLERHPPTHEVEIVENTSWSCAHGIDRWRRNCGCASGQHPSWNQEWRTPLREALDWLRDSVTPAYDEAAQELLRDPWVARNDYIELILDRSRDRRARFFQRHATRALSEADQTRALKLLEMQRHAMLMYTSCGWFFDDVSGIETVQVIQYAGRVLQLAQDTVGLSLEEGFLSRLEAAQSNVPERGNGRQIYERAVRPTMLSLDTVGAHYAVSSLFGEYADQDRVYCYTIANERYRRLSAGRARLAVGRARVASDVTDEQAVVSFSVVHLGDHNVTGGIRRYHGDEEEAADHGPIVDAFSRADIPEVLRLIDRKYEGGTYSLKALFHDEQRRVLDQILNSTLDEAESVYRQLYEVHAPLMRFLSDLRIPLPKGLQLAAEFALNNSLRRALGTIDLDLAQVSSLLAETERAGAALDRPHLAFTLTHTLDALVARFRAEPQNLDRLAHLVDAVELSRRLPFDISYWRAQNEYYALLRTVFPGVRARADYDEGARTWLELFVGLGELLRVRVNGD
jgi:alpha-amylase/alpha-mannosidase (GH57 family)